MDNVENFPSKRLFKEHPADQLFDLVSILAVVRDSETDPPREQGSIEWGHFVLIGKVMDELRVLASRFGNDIEMVKPDAGGSHNQAVGESC